MTDGLYDDPEGKDYALWGLRATAEVFESAAAASQAALFAIL